MKEESPSFRAWPESEPYQVAVTTYHECRPDARRNDQWGGSRLVEKQPGREYELFVGIDIAAKTATIA